MFDPAVWSAVPFHFWSVAIFILGCVVGSFLNVCIHRMPRNESLISPPSHCPHCNYAIPWYLNIPLATWLILRGKCANCKAPISPRYLLVELITGVAFLGCWLQYGRNKPLVALVYCLVLAGFVVAMFIDFEFLIIPDEITIGGMVVGFLISSVLPSLHDVKLVADSMKASGLGILVGSGIIYGIVRLGKLLFGRQTCKLEPNTRVIFTETGVCLPEEIIPFEDLFYRKSDSITLQAKTAELIDRCYSNVNVSLSPKVLRIGDETLDPEQVPHLEVVTDTLILPREAMGFGDVKFMGAIGAFLGWEATLFSLMISSVLGALVGCTLIVLKKQAWSSRLPYGPYIAAAAVLWIFGGKNLYFWWITPRL